MALLESALGRPRHLFANDDPSPTIVEMAGAYAYGIARNHSFIDENKRTAAVVCETFLVLNGVELTATDAEAYPIFLGLAAGALSEQQFTDWLKQHTKQIEK